MQFERINDNKIKVIFLREDIRQWNVNIKNLAENTQEMQNMVWSVLRLAEKEIGFSINGAQLQVEAVPKSEDEFIIIITRLPAASNRNHIRGARVVPPETVVKKRPKGGAPIYIFRFLGFDDAVKGAKAIAGSFAGRSALYKYEEKFYITIIPFNKDAFFELGNIMSEYSEKMAISSLIEGRLREYGKQMIESGAVEILAQEF